MTVEGWGAARARPVGQFVGRRDLLRVLPEVLDGDAYSGLVLYGIGGIGKTTLAAESVRRATAGDPDRRVAAMYGPVGVDGLLSEVAAVARRELLSRGLLAGPRAAAVQAAARVDVGWADRFASLREHVLEDIPILVVLDDFEDNLIPNEAGGWSTADPLLAELLERWLADPGRSRFVVTSRHRIAWPPAAERRMSVQPVGPLSAAETAELLPSLPWIDRHTGADGVAERVWRLVGGHPGALEYLDGLLDHGTARFEDVTDRLASAITSRLGVERVIDWLNQERTLEAALAGAVTLIADDVLLSRHLDRLAKVPGAVEALAAISVYREPVPVLALAFHLGSPIPPDQITPKTTDRRKAETQIVALLADHGLESDDLAAALEPDGPLPTGPKTALRELLAVAKAPPQPPMGLPAGIDDVVRRLAGGRLIHHDPDRGTVFMPRWTATELRRHAPAGSGGADRAHRAAADYWRWRAMAWPQDTAARMHDRTEARHHLFAAYMWDEASLVTEHIRLQLREWGARDGESSLIHDTLRRLPATSPRRAAWIDELGKLPPLW